MHSDGKIFVPYIDYYNYLADESWVQYESRIYYHGSPGLVYSGLNAEGIPAQGTSISQYAIGQGSSGSYAQGNGFTSSFGGILLGIPKYYDNDDNFLVTRISPYAFYGCNQLQRITMSDSIRQIDQHAFYGCTSVKFVIMEGATPPTLSVDAAGNDQSFANMAADRVFVVPNAQARQAYVNADGWRNYAAFIITWDEYLLMSSGSGFTHFVFNIPQERTFTFNIQKHDSSMMTIIYGDGTSDTISDKGAIAKSHIFPAGIYTMSLIARGPWNFMTGVNLTGSTSYNGYVTEVYFDNNFISQNAAGETIINDTIKDTKLLEGCYNLEVLKLPTTSVGRLPEGFLRHAYKLRDLQIPFIGRSATPYADNGEIRYGYLGYLFGTTEVAGLTKVDQTNGDMLNSFSYYIPSTLNTVTVSRGSFVPAGAFSNCQMIGTINIPQTVTEIQGYAFYNCKSLGSFAFPSDVDTLGVHAFDGCSNITNTSIPSDITMIDDYVFSGCSNLALTSLPSGITSIGIHSFDGCKKLAISAIPNGVTTIGEYAFSDCEKITISTLPSAITTLNQFTFNNCKEITLSSIPSGMTTIPNNLFNNCNKVTFSSLPSSITSVGDYAFANCYLVTFSLIASTVVNIGQHAFENCATIGFAELPTNLAYIGAYAFSGATGLAISSIPPNVTALPEACFKNCPNIQVSTIPVGVTTIGKEAFYGCSNLRITNLPNNCTIDEASFMNCNSIQLTSLPSSLAVIPDRSFYGCSNIAIHYIPARVKRVGVNAFYGCTGLTDIQFGDPANPISEEDISYGDYSSGKSILIAPYSSGGNQTSGAFEGCYNLAKVSFYSPDGGSFPTPSGFPWGNNGLVSTSQIFKYRGYSPIKDADLANYMNCEYDQLNEEYTIVSINVDYWQQALSGATTPVISIGATFNDGSHGSHPITAIGDGAFIPASGKEGMIPLGTQISFSDDSMISRIGSNAFKNGVRYGTIRLPKTVSIIGNNAFEGCTNLEINELPADLRTIGDYAFKNCTKANFAILPTYIQNIGIGCFDGCINITKLSMDSCDQLITVDISSPTSNINECTLPTRGFYLEEFRTPNVNYTLTIKFRVNPQYPEDYMILDASTTLSYGFKVVASGRNLYAGNNLIYENLVENVDYTLIIRGDTSNNLIMNSAIFVVGTQEFNRFRFGYEHPVVSVNGTPTTFGISGLRLTQVDDAVKMHMADISLIDYVNRTLSDSEIEERYYYNLYILPSQEYLESAYAMRVDFDTLTRVTAGDGTVSYSKEGEATYTTGNDGNGIDRFSVLTWSQVMALGREGFIVTNPAPSQPYRTQLGIMRNGAQEIWLQCGECKSATIDYEAGSSYTSCNNEEGNPGPMWFEIVGFFTDQSDHLAPCPITLGMKNLLPEKSQLYSASHYMRDAYLTMDPNNLTNGYNATTITNTTGAAARAWLVAKDITTISKISISTGSLKGWVLNSTASAGFKMFPLNTEYVSEVGYFDDYKGPGNTNYWTYTSDETGSDTFNPDIGYSAGATCRYKNQIYTCKITYNVTPAPESECLYIDARFGKFKRDESSECCVMTPGCMIGIPVPAGASVTITYYQSWNLTGWRDCIVRQTGNGVHFNALNPALRDIVQPVTKYTNIGGLHTTINETTDKMWLYSLIEAGMYNATIPYCKEGKALQFYQPSVASNGGRTTVRRKYLHTDQACTYDYWWLRTPQFIPNDAFSPSMRIYCISLNGRSYAQYSTASYYGVCFGLSTKTTYYRSFHCFDKWQSSKLIPILAASASNPKSKISHIYSFRILDKAVNETIVDMRYGSAVSGNTDAGFAISNGTTNGIMMNSLSILPRSMYNNGDKITIIIRLPEAANSSTTSDILVYVNDVLKNTIQSVSYTSGSIGAYARKYSTSHRKAIVGGPNTIFEFVSIFDDELTNDQLNELFVLQYLKNS